MHFPALNRVECAILHTQFHPLDGKRLFQEIQKLTIELNYAPEVQLMATSTVNDIHVHAAGHRILVSQNDQPLEPEGFRNALTTPYTGMVFPDARAAVEQHRANTFITIAKGVLDTQIIPEKLRELLGEDAYDEMSAKASFRTPEEADRAWKFCCELTKLIINNNPASAVHWCVSDNLVPQPLFERLTEDDDLTLLNVRPYLTSSAGKLGDGLPLGMYLHGSQWVIGKMIEFEEAPVPFSWMMDVVVGFIKMCQIRGSILPDRNTFSTEGEDWTVAVFHEKIEGHTAWEKVRLVVVNAPQFGIFGDTTAKRYHKYESADDIRARAEDEKNEVHAANDPQPCYRRAATEADLTGPGTPAEDAPPASGGTARETPVRRHDMRELREFAKRSSAPAPAAAKMTGETKGLLNRARGWFSRT